jgi:hypothetical protein
VVTQQLLQKSRNEVLFNGPGEQAMHQWLTSVILVADIKKIMVQGQPRQKSRPYLKNTQHPSHPPPHTTKGLVEWRKW